MMKTCGRGHKRAVDVIGCAECRKITSKAWYHRNIDEKRAYMRKASKAGYKRNKNEYRDKKRKRIYGITPDKYQEMLLSQDNACAICKQKFSKTPCIDHCHATNMVRGLLCNPCNRALGLFQDDLINLANAITYLSLVRRQDENSTDTF